MHQAKMDWKAQNLKLKTHNKQELSKNKQIRQKNIVIGTFSYPCSSK
jgi:hypothetical protein